jgi:hypothetical protein
MTSPGTRTGGTATPAGEPSSTEQLKLLTLLRSESQGRGRWRWDRSRRRPLAFLTLEKTPTFTLRGSLFGQHGSGVEQVHLGDEPRPGSSDRAHRRGCRKVKTR